MLMEFLSKGSAVRQMIAQNIFGSLSNVVICLPPMHTRGRNVSHFYIIVDQIIARLVLSGFPALLLLIVYLEIQDMYEFSNHSSSLPYFCIFLLEITDSENVL